MLSSTRFNDRNTNYADLICDDIFSITAETYVTKFTASNSYQTVYANVLDTEEQAMLGTGELSFMLMSREKDAKSAQIYSIEQASNKPTLTSFGRDKDSFIKYMKRNIMQPVNFEFEQVTYRIYIDDVIMLPQGCSAVYDSMGELKEEPSVIVCDIGSWTGDTFRMDHCTPNADTCRSLEFGIIRMMDKVLEEVRSNTGLSITSAQAERIMKNLPCSMDDKAKEIIENQGRLYIDNLIKTLLESGFDTSAIPTIFIGGGTLLVEKNIDQSKYVNIIFVNDIKANAIVYEKLARIMTGTENER